MGKREEKSISFNQDQIRSGAIHNKLRHTFFCLISHRSAADVPLIEKRGSVSTHSLEKYFEDRFHSSQLRGVNNSIFFLRFAAVFFCLRFALEGGFSS